MKLNRYTDVPAEITAHYAGDIHSATLKGSSTIIVKRSGIRGKQDTWKKSCGTWTKQEAQTNAQQNQAEELPKAPLAHRMLFGQRLNDRRIK